MTFLIFYKDQHMNKFIYTAFDGDDMLYIDMMRDFVVQHGFVPLNPEHAFGYYVTTTMHSNSKKEVMRDCFALSNMCDEFWVFTNHKITKRNKLNLLSEGVLAEMIMWCRKCSADISKDPKIKIINIKEMISYLQKSDASKKKNELKEMDICSTSLSTVLEKNMFEELNQFVEKSEMIRKAVFINIEDKNYKYIDWVRIEAYKNDLIPIVPQCIIPRPVFELNGKSKKYQKIVDDLIGRTNEIWTIVESRKEKTKDGNGSVKLLKELGLPKFQDIDEWAITTKEKLENLNSLNK